MPIIFISLSETYTEKIKRCGFEAKTMRIQDYIPNPNKNAYYATIASLYNILINKKENMEDVDIIFTSFCCGYGKMDEDVSIQQILDGINDYSKYNPKAIYNNIIINEPNLLDQPKYYQN